MTKNGNDRLIHVLRPAPVCLVSTVGADHMKGYAAAWKRHLCFVGQVQVMWSWELGIGERAEPS